MSNPKYASTAETAEYFGIALSTLSKQLHTGEIPPECYVRFGRVYRFNIEALEAHKLRQSAEPVTPQNDPRQLNLELYNDNYGDDE